GIFLDGPRRTGYAGRFSLPASNHSGVGYASASAVAGLGPRSISPDQCSAFTPELDRAAPRSIGRPRFTFRAGLRLWPSATGRIQTGNWLRACHRNRGRIHHTGIGSPVSTVHAGNDSTYRHQPRTLEKIT